MFYSNAKFPFFLQGTNFWKLYEIKLNQKKRIQKWHPEQLFKILQALELLEALEASVGWSVSFGSFAEHNPLSCLSALPSLADEPSVDAAVWLRVGWEKGAPSERILFSLCLRFLQPPGRLMAGELGIFARPSTKLAVGRGCERSRWCPIRSWAKHLSDKYSNTWRGRSINAPSSFSGHFSSGPLKGVRVHAHSHSPPFGLQVVVLVVVKLDTHSYIF